MMSDLRMSYGIMSDHCLPIRLKYCRSNVVFFFIRQNMCERKIGCSSEVFHARSASHSQFVSAKVKETTEPGNDGNVLITVEKIKPIFTEMFKQKLKKLIKIVDAPITPTNQ